MEKFQNKYRIPSARLQHWDYGSQVAYFITICTANRQHFFGTITNGVMQLNELGQIAHKEWLKTIDLRPDMNLEMGEFVVMPNHFHAVIIIGANRYNNPNTTTQSQNKFGPQRKNLSSIIRGFKSSVTTQARKIGNTNFNWQTRFYDHIIRNLRSFERIENYIIRNPKSLPKDKFYD